jgi:hypothetical protein
MESDCADADMCLGVVMARSVHPVILRPELFVDTLAILISVQVVHCLFEISLVLDESRPSPWANP